MFCTRRPETFEAAREERLKVSGNPAQYDDLGVFMDEQERMRALVEASSLPALTVDVSDDDVAGAAGEASNPAPVPGSDSNPTGEPEVIIPDRYKPDLANGANGVGEATVYFTPQDENTSTTVMFLYNTSAVTATVGIETFRLDGSTYINTDVAVPPNGLVRICGDSVSGIGTWNDVVLVNFTTSSTYGRMTLPDGVKADGYVAWNGGGTYDPLDAVPTLPLRFSIDPPTVFLPAAQRN